MVIFPPLRSFDRSDRRERAWKPADERMREFFVSPTELRLNRSMERWVLRAIAYTEMELGRGE